MKYNTNPQMRPKILDTATMLFYDIGCEKTTFDRIASELGIAKSLITYHFGTKLNLAYEVFEEKRYDAVSLIARKISQQHFGVSLDVYSSVYDRIMLRQLRDDRKAFELFKMASTNKSNGKDFSRDIYSIFSDAFARGQHDDRWSVLTPWASRGAASTIIEAYFDNHLEETISYTDFEDYRASLRYRLVLLPENQMNEILEESRRVADSLDITFLPYYKIE